MFSNDRELFRLVSRVDLVRGNLDFLLGHESLTTPGQHLHCALTLRVIDIVSIDSLLEHPNTSPESSGSCKDSSEVCGGLATSRFKFKRAPVTEFSGSRIAVPDLHRRPIVPPVSCLVLVQTFFNELQRLRKPFLLPGLKGQLVVGKCRHGFPLSM